MPGGGGWRGMNIGDKILALSFWGSRFQRLDLDQIFCVWCAGSEHRFGPLVFNISALLFRCYGPARKYFLFPRESFDVFLLEHDWWWYYLYALNQCFSTIVEGKPRGPYNRGYLAALRFFCGSRETRQPRYKNKKNKTFWNYFYIPAVVFPGYL